MCYGKTEFSYVARHGVNAVVVVSGLVLPEVAIPALAVSALVLPSELDLKHFSFPLVDSVAAEVE